MCLIWTPVFNNSFLKSILYGPRLIINYSRSWKSLKFRGTKTLWESSGSPPGVFQWSSVQHIWARKFYWAAQKGHKNQTGKEMPLGTVVSLWRSTIWRNQTCYRIRWKIMGRFRRRSPAYRSGARRFHPRTNSRSWLSWRHTDWGKIQNP